jgi:crossover junction endodeoxyribonuclease RuvC
MKIIAIDPGYDRVGVAILEKNDPARESLVFSTCITTDKKSSFYDRMQFVQQEITSLITLYHPELLVIEQLYFAKNTKTALQVSEAKGIIVGTVLLKNIPVVEIHPNHIKIAITGYGAAKKEDILFMLPKLIDFDEKKRLDDELDAIAIGVAYFAHHKKY